MSMASCLYPGRRSQSNHSIKEGKQTKKKFVLELTFENEEGKRRKIDIDNPKLGLTEEEIIPAMQKIIDFKKYPKFEYEYGDQFRPVMRNFRPVNVEQSSTECESCRPFR